VIQRDSIDVLGQTLLITIIRGWEISIRPCEFDNFALADARRVGRELRRLGVQRRIVSQSRAKTGWDSLTDSELTVVNLIAQGATNRSVAERLHVTPHTVKAHLHNAFAKLGINSRAELSKLTQGTDRPIS
jgi:DNA-binding CsgD family transcriptional regulator